MYATFNHGAKTYVEELKGPRQLQAALNSFRGPYLARHIQIRLLRVNGKRVVRLKDPMDTTCFIRAALASAFLLALSIGSASASDYTPTAPIGCHITHYWAEDDMSAIAICAGGYTVHKEAGPVDDWDIPFAVGSTRVGPDAAGAYHDFPVWD